MFEHWTQFAIDYAPSIGVAPATALNVHGMLCTTLGEEWIDDQERRIGLPARTIADGHPLFRAMCGRTERCVVEVCELAGYLLVFRNDPGLRDVIIALRDSAKYAPAVQELAFAWKFRNAGAIVSLGPKTLTGVADFRAEVTGRDRLVEVSGFPSDPFRGDLMAFMGAMQNALKSGLRKASADTPIAVEIDMAHGDRHSELRKLRAAVHAGVVAAIREAVRGGLRAEKVFDFGVVRVRRAGAQEVPDLERWSIAACATLVPRSALDLVGVGIDYRKGKDTDWIYIRVPNEVRDPYKKIKSKLKIESRQLRGCNDGVIVVIINGLLCGALSDNDPKLRAVIEDFARHHGSTTAIAIVTTPEKVDGTTGVAGAYFELGPSALPKTFWQSVVSMDGERSVLRELDGFT